MSNADDFYHTKCNTVNSIADYTTNWSWTSVWVPWGKNRDRERGMEGERHIPRINGIRNSGSLGLRGTAPLPLPMNFIVTY